MRRQAIILLLLCAVGLPAASVDVQMTVSLVNPGSPAISVPTTRVAAAVGVPFTLAVSLGNPPATFSAEGLPPGLVIDPTTGVITGTPTAAGTSVVTIRATNANGTSSLQFEIIVHDQSGGTTDPPGLWNRHGGVGCGAGRATTLMLLLALAVTGRLRRRTP